MLENNLLLVKGAVPGPKKSLVTIKADSKAYNGKEEDTEWLMYLFIIWKAMKLAQWN